MAVLEVKYKKINPEAYPPFRGSAFAAGWDLSSPADYDIPPNSCIDIDIGLAFEFPEGCYGRIVERSSMAKRSISVNGGVIDSDYRGSLKTILFNHNPIPFHIERGDRIVQLICERYAPMQPVEADQLSETVRGNHGLGSSGLSHIDKPQKSV